MMNIKTVINNFSTLTNRKNKILREIMTLNGINTLNNNKIYTQSEKIDKSLYKIK